MKRILILAAAAVAVIGMTSLATAGDYHVGSQLICSDCHVMHGSASHADAVGDTAHVPIAPGGPFPKLLRGATVNNACLTCHDGRNDAPDVLCDNSNQTGTPNGRRAGALNAAPNAYGVTNTGSYTEADGHSLFSTATPPGAIQAAPVSAEGLECTDCHGAHGNAYYRNMQGTTATSTSTFIPPQFRGKEVFYQVGGTIDPVANPNSWVYEALPHNYDNSNVNYLEPDQTRSAYGEWCGTCHGNFHGAPGAGNIGSAGDEVRHPTAGTNFSASGWAVPAPYINHRLKVMDAAGHWDVASGFDANMTPSCFTCHKSHGNANPYGLIFVIPNRTTGGPAAEPTRLATLTEEGDGGALRDMCRNCHGMGSFPAGNPTNILP